MNRETWENLSFFEQLSNIDGDVERLIRAHNKYKNGSSETDLGYFYLDNIKKLIRMTVLDPKNSSRAYCAIELMDEAEELRLYLEGSYSDQYIRNYWNMYTRAVAANNEKS